MKRVFMQTYCRYPHGGAAANYVENFAKAFRDAGYSVVLISDLNKEYKISNKEHFDFFEAVYIIEPNKDENISKIQRKYGFANERIDALEKEFIKADDIVFTYGLYNEYMLDRLFEYRNKIGFKVICGITEMFALEDYNTPDKFKIVESIRGITYLKADAILSISDYIDNYYFQRNTRTFKFPPIIDFESNTFIKKTYKKIKFIIPSGKDSLLEMLKAFSMLDEFELKRIEIHLCGIKDNMIKEILNTSELKCLNSVMVIHKWIKYEELKKLYKEMHFLLIARKRCQRTLANFPSKVPECMNLGIVPIVSDVGDYTKYYLEDAKNSIFIHGDSAEEIKNAIRKAISLSFDEYKEYSNYAIKCAEEKFDYRCWLPQIKEMIESI